MSKGEERTTPSDAPPAGRAPNEDEMRATDYSDAARLMTQPIAGMAVLSAIGIGMATQAFGLWLTAVSSAMQGAHRDPGAEPVRQHVKPETGSADPVAQPEPSAEAKVVKFVSKADRAKTPKRKAEAATTAKVRSPKAASKAGDDLKAISGVGPKLESVLNSLGIRRYAEVAALTETQIGALEDQLGIRGRIARDDWTGQAKALMAGGKA